jgi:hypothetical protein
VTLAYAVGTNLQANKAQNGDQMILEKKKSPKKCCLNDF